MATTTYALGTHEGQPFIRCLHCGMRSFHGDDIRELYCGRCHRYHRRNAELRFPLGDLLITPGAQEALTSERVQECLRRHWRGDWGDVCEEDRGANDAALQHGARLLSVYPVAEGSAAKFWIITEADRSSTTVLLPEEY